MPASLPASGGLLAIFGVPGLEVQTTIFAFMLRGALPGSVTVSESPLSIRDTSLTVLGAHPPPI